MHFISIIKELIKDNELVIFVDMDGVIVNYDVGKPYNFRNKRPLNNNINIFKELSKLDKIELCILSICNCSVQVNEKNEWLDEYAPFFKNRNIISRNNDFSISSALLKTNFLKNYKSNKKIVLVDDDNGVLKKVKKEIKDIKLFQDSELID